MVLISVSIVISNVEHIFVYLLVIHILWKNVYLGPLSIFKLDYMFFAIELYIGFILEMLKNLLLENNQFRIGPSPALRAVEVCDSAIFSLRVLDFSIYHSFIVLVYKSIHSVKITKSIICFNTSVYFCLS